ncbi:tyrosine-type recombinase/integrase [Microbacterium keratanolyticum]
MTTAPPTSRPRHCEGSAHADGTHGHDGQDARFDTRTHCRACGFTADLRLCAGRVQDMLSNAAGVRCARCGTVYAQSRDMVTVRPIATGRAPARRTAGAPQSAAPDEAAVLERYRDDQAARGHSSATIRLRIGTLAAVRDFCGTLLDATEAQLSSFLGRPGLKPASRRTYYTQIRSFYQYAHAHGFVSVDPSADLPKARMPRGKPRPFSREQIERLLTSGAYHRTRVMILLGYYQGFRVSSIAAVHGRDVDLVRGSIVTTVKGGKTRSLPLHPLVAEVARDMPRDAYWFPARGRDGHIHGAAVTNLITRAKHRAGITDRTLTPHSLRHSFASHLVEDGVDIRVVQELMTHDDLSSTQVYAGVSSRRIRAGIDTLEPMPVPTHSGRAGSNRGTR